MKKSQKFFYGWYIVFACFMIQAIPFGIAKNVQTQFISFVIDENGFTLSGFTLMFTIGVVVSAFVSPLIGKLFDSPKTNVRLLYVVGSILCGGGFFLFGFCHELWQFYGVSSLVEVGTAMIQAIGIPVLINAWFKENKGTALGIAFAGGGIGNIFLQQIASIWLRDPAVGVSRAYFYFGIVSFIVALVISLVFIRMPSASELDLSQQEEIKQRGNKWGYSFEQLKQDVMFWLFALAWIFAGLFISAMVVQFITYFNSIGYANKAGNIGSVFAFTSIFGSLFGGILFSKTGSLKSLLLAEVLLLVSSLCLVFAKYHPLLPYVFAACHGIAVYSYIIGPSFLCGVLFGDAHYGSIIAVINIFFAIGYALGSYVFALIQERFGWTVEWMIVTVMVLLSYSLMMIATSYFLRKNEKEGLHA